MLFARGTAFANAGKRGGRGGFARSLVSRNTMLRGSRVVRDRHDSHKEKKMGKYFLAWLLGVPAGILVLVFVVMHVF